MNVLYQSDFCNIINYLCECTDCTLSKPEYQDRFSFCFIRTGNFQFKAFRSELDSHTGRILINKPGYDYRVAHVHDVPDQCTIFSFNPSFFDELADHYSKRLNGLLQKRDVQSILIKSTPGIDYIHWRIFSSLIQKKFTALEIDALLVELVERVFALDHAEAEFHRIPQSQKSNYLPRMESAKEYIHNNFSDKTSLNDIASQCAMSAFHFARIFRRIVGETPHQYVSQFRFAHASHLLKTTNLPLSEISFLAGYNSPSHFSTAFRQKIDLPPKSFRSPNK